MMESVQLIEEQRLDPVSMLKHKVEVDDALSNDGSINSSATANPVCKIEDSKVLFYEMMAQLLRHQLRVLEGCDNTSEGISEESISRFPRLCDEDSSHSFMLQPSLFPLMYPTVYFSARDDDLSTVPNEVKSFLRWKMSTITANTMKAIVSRSGYRLITADKTKNKSWSNWNAIWCKHLKVSEFNNIGYYQRVNHFPGSYNFGRKDRLWINLKAKADKFGYDVFGNFHPPTFILPQDYSSLIEYWNPVEGESGSDSSKSERKLFICKPPASARGQGINIVSTVDELHTLMAACNPAGVNTLTKKPKVTMVVQQYIDNPCLLANDAKFDLRVYVLITSISPLRLYVYEDGLVRFASNRYSKSVEDISNQFIHLTNYSVNKNSVEYIPSSSTDGQEGHKWTLSTLWRYLVVSGKRTSAELANLWQAMCELIVKTVISAEGHILSLLKQHLKNKKSCFELLGFDIMLDENFKLWLLECNITPSLRADSVLDFSVKNKLVSDILNTVGYHLSPRFRKFYNFGSLMAPDKNDLLTQMKAPDDEKHRKYETQYLSSGISACDDIIDSLNDDDVYQLMESEDELSRCGQFRRIFPTTTSGQYLSYFDFPYYYNLLLIKWEERYHSCREVGRARLRQHMRQMETSVERRQLLQKHLCDLEKLIDQLRSQFATTSIPQKS